MNGDLISRSALLESLKKSREHHAETSRDLSLLCRCENIVRERPIAYNVDRVVEQLEALQAYAIDGDCPKDGMCDGGDCEHCHINMALEIVKKGGVE